MTAIETASGHIKITDDAVNYFHNSAFNSNVVNAVNSGEISSENINQLAETYPSQVYKNYNFFKK